MSHDDTLALLNVLRGVSFTLFTVVVVQVGYILKHYFQAWRLERQLEHPRAGLLPAHVVVLGLALILALGECVGQNVTHFNEGGTYFTFLNPVLLGLTTYGLTLVMEFEYTRYRHALDHKDLPKYTDGV